MCVRQSGLLVGELVDVETEEKVVDFVVKSWVGVEPAVVVGGSRGDVVLEEIGGDGALRAGRRVVGINTRGGAGVARGPGAVGRGGRRSAGVVGLRKCQR